MSASAKRSPLIDLTQDQNVLDLAMMKHTTRKAAMPVGFVSGSVVGIRYADGEAHLEEYVELVREPSNPYDANAVRVDNLSGQQSLRTKGGTHPVRACAALAPIVDQNIANWMVPFPPVVTGRKSPFALSFVSLLDAVLQQHGLLLHRMTNVPEELQQPSIQTVESGLEKKQQMDKVFDTSW